MSFRSLSAAGEGPLANRRGRGGPKGLGMEIFTVDCDLCQGDELERLACDKCYGTGRVPIPDVSYDVPLPVARRVLFWGVVIGFACLSVWLIVPAAIRWVIQGLWP